jgi:hypothetical protein
MCLPLDIGLVLEDRSIHQIGKQQGYLLDGELNYNSGVILFHNKASILERWKEMALTSQFLDDQYALARVIYQYKPTLLELPLIFNWPDDYGQNEHAVIRHFHGARGKLAILNSLNI